MISFPRAPRVAPGDTILASQFRGLAEAINARPRSGLGNGAQRMVYYQLGWARSMRNQDESGYLTPPWAEFFSSGYQQLRPDQGTWPITGPGDPEGASLNNLMMAYVFGSDTAGLYDEATRLSDPNFGGVDLWIDGHPPVTPEECWRLKKNQMGAWDPATGAVASPVLAAARSHGNLRATRLSPHGNSNGGYFAGPELVVGVNCEDPNPVTMDGVTISSPPPNYAIFFTPITAGLPVVSFDGTCVDGPAISTPGMYDTHVASIFEDYQWMVYRITLWSGATTTLSMLDYVQGPYTGQAALKRDFGNHLDRILNRFIADFRGKEQTDANEAAARPANWNLYAADLKRFMLGQYLLAPQLGRETDGEVQPYYPRWVKAAAQGAGSLPFENGGTDYVLHDGCVSTAAFARGVAVTVPTTIRIEADGEFAGSLAIAPGDSSSLLTFTEPIAAGKTVAVIADDGFGFGAPNGIVEVEITEQMTYKPNLSDWFLVLRLSGAVE